MSTLKFNQWLNPDNTENFKCRAWVNFNGVGTVAIRAAGNVSSITDFGVGTYIVNFTNAMPDANYAISTGCANQANNTDTANNTFSLTTAGFTLQHIEINAVGDLSLAMVSVFR